jgi:hypothetical protein
MAEMKLTVVEVMNGIGEVLFKRLLRQSVSVLLLREAQVLTNYLGARNIVDALEFDENNVLEIIAYSAVYR